MIYKPFKDIQLSALGMGNMRLPSADPKDRDAAILYEGAIPIIHEAYHGGINYFDTAYVYNGGDSEKCVGVAMKDFDRDSFYLATKFHIGVNSNYKEVFETELERLQTDHIDFYLLHCLQDDNIDKYLESGAIEYFLKKKEEGKIRYLGFSTHAGMDTLRRYADHHAWDFAQIQMNYYDWIYGTAKEEYEILTERNIPIVVMEPVRGGVLADLPEEVMEILRAAHPDWNAAKWAFRFVKSFENVRVILSGMSTTDQVKDNLNTFADDEGLTKEEMELVFKAAELFKKRVQVPCTSCRYCCSPCPQSINIPAYLKIYNNWKVEGASAFWGLDDVESEGKPADCLECGACMQHCPQGIDIPTLLKEIAVANA